MRRGWLTAFGLRSSCLSPLACGYIVAVDPVSKSPSYNSQLQTDFCHCMRHIYAWQSKCCKARLITSEGMAVHIHELHAAASVILHTSDSQASTQPPAAPVPKPNS